MKLSLPSLISSILLVGGSAVLSKQKLVMSACFGTYPGYEGDIDITAGGSSAIVLFNDDGTLAFTYKIKGAEINCYDCGIRILKGMTCDNATEVGKHYWDSKNNTVPDPWTPAYGAVYNTGALGIAVGRFRLDSGFGFDENLGHAAVVHAQDGSRIGCGILQKGRRNARACNIPKKQPLQTCIRPYPGYNGNFTKIKGKVMARYSFKGYSFKWRIKNGDTDCDICKLCIYSGVGCAGGSNLTAGGRNLDYHNCIPDGAIYTTNSTGKGNGIDHAASTRGFNYTEDLGDTVIVHDSEGVPYGCGVLGTDPVTGCMQFPNV